MIKYFLILVALSIGYTTKAQTSITASVNNSDFGILNGTQVGEGIYATNTICNNLEAGVMSFSPNLTLYNNIIRGNVPVFRPQDPENVDARLNG